MRRSSCVYLLGLVFLISATALAIDSPRELSQFGHDVWLTENGLPQNTVHAIAQTADGYIWIGTEEGLARFDGVKFTVFDKQNTPEIKNNYSNLCLDDYQHATAPGSEVRQWACHREPNQQWQLTDAPVPAMGPGDLIGQLGQLGQIIARNPGTPPPPDNPPPGNPPPGNP